LRNRLLFSIFIALLLSLAGGPSPIGTRAKIEAEMQAAIAVGARFARNAFEGVAYCFPC